MARKFMALTSGTKLGPYEIQVPLGAGGMGEVYRACDTRLNRDVAIKVLPASFANDPDRLQRFAQESRAAAALNHPNILSIHDVGEDRGIPYVVTELLEGESLRERMRTGALPTRKAIDFARQIANGLAAAHAKGIVHRDLKPENLFITSDGRVKILDFGLAKFTRPESESSDDAPTLQVATEVGTVLGTAGYMSPEQVRGKPADARSDIFSFGTILYEMLSGKRAFHGDSTADTMSAILKEDPPELSQTNRNVPPALEAIVRHCLEKNPAERFQSAKDVAFNLDTLTDVSSASRGGVHALSEPASSHRWLPIAKAAAVGVLIAAAYFVGRRTSFSPNPIFHEVTFRNGTILQARFAPDGQAIAYSAAWDGQPQEIFSTRYDSSDSRSIGLPSGQVLAISSKGELAVSVRLTNFAFYTSGTLARVPLAGGAPREVLDGVVSADWTPDGQDFAVARENPPTHYAHLEFPPGNQIYIPKGWISHVRFSPSGRYLAFFDHIPEGDDGRLVVTDTHGNRKVTSSFYSSVEGLAWSPDGKEVWFSAVPAGAVRAIYALDLSGKERLIYRSPAGLTIHDISRIGLILLTSEKMRMGVYGLPPGETRERSLSWFDWSVVTDMSADGRNIIISESGEAVGANYCIYLRKMDGSPAVRLGDGVSGFLSPDGQWVLTTVGSPQKAILVPTGAGQSRQLLDEKSGIFDAAWLPDGKSVVYMAAQPGHALRSYLLDLNGGVPRPLTPEGTAGSIISPDGKFLLAQDDARRLWLYPIAGGEPRKSPVVLQPTEQVFRFIGPDAILTAPLRTIPLDVVRVDVTSGHREPWKTIAPADPAGVHDIPVIKFSADGKSYAYSTARILSDLYVVDGLK